MVYRREVSALGDFPSKMPESGYRVRSVLYKCLTNGSMDYLLHLVLACAVPLLGKYLPHSIRDGT